MANVSRRICYVTATLRVKMVQTKTTVNVLPACSTVRMEDAFCQHPCAMERMTVPMETTKKIAVSYCLILELINTRVGYEAWQEKKITRFLVFETTTVFNLFCAHTLNKPIT